VDASVFVEGALRNLDAIVEETTPRVLQQSDEEALHDLRVAIRRMRVLLKVARPIYTKFYANAVREPFTAFHRATSALRDEEVLEEILASIAVKDAAFERYKKMRKRRERRLRKDIIARIELGQVTHARRKLAALIELPVKPKRRVELTTFAREVVLEAQKSVEKLRDVPVTDVEGLHELRIAYKNLRYTAEIFADGLPIDLSALADPAKRMQTLLGDLHDVDVAIATVQKARSLSPGVSARIVRSLRRMRAKRVRDYTEASGYNRLAS